MSRQGRPKAPAPPCDPARDPETIALRIHQIAATAGVIAETQNPPLSHALYLIEETLLEVEARVESLRRLPAASRS